MGLFGLKFQNFTVAPRAWWPGELQWTSALEPPDLIRWTVGNIEVQGGSPRWHLPAILSFVHEVDVHEGWRCEAELHELLSRTEGNTRFQSWTPKFNQLNSTNHDLPSVVWTSIWTEGNFDFRKFVTTTQKIWDLVHRVRVGTLKVSNFALELQPEEALCIKRVRQFTCSYA